MAGPEIREKFLYFIAKCKDIPSLKHCLETRQWACRCHQNPPNPPEVLKDAFLSGNPVVLIFSVNNCHGWHGYALMENVPGSVSPENVSLQTENHGTSEPDKNICEAFAGSKDWQYFSVRWEKCFLSSFGEQCLPYHTTEDLMLTDGLPVNKYRNWQWLPENTGKNICQLIDDHFNKLEVKHQKKEEKRLENRPKPFLSSTITDEKACWLTLINKVETELGQVLLACPFGSQRYNLQGEASDVDIFVVYQADTKKLLGFNPPKQTIKNSEHEHHDYTLVEVHRYCELLLAGDPKCVETLFLQQSTIVKHNSDWVKLQQFKSSMMNRACLDKYMGDACGTRGMKKLRKWCDDNPGVKKIPARICKLIYIIVRLLYCARSIARDQHLRIYFDSVTEERDILMAIRSGEMSLQDSQTLIRRLQAEIEEKKATVPHLEPCVKEDIEQWLIEIRYKNFLKTSDGLERRNIDIH
ncbi:hypothetical protein ScPMuIL_016311 [Solemya velum]